MNLCDLLKKSLASQETGQLVVKFEGVTNLCKISINKGQAVFIQLGTMGPGETLDYITDKTPVQANFIPGVPPRRQLDSPLNDTLCAIVEMQSDMSAAEGRDQPVPEIRVSSPDEQIPSEQISAIISDFIDLVGPLGKVLVEKALGRMGYQKDQPVGKSDYLRFIQNIAEEIPEGDRQKFLKKYTEN